MEWTARLEEHIGTFRVEPMASRTAAIMADGAALAALGGDDGAGRRDAAGAGRASGLYGRSLDLVEALGVGPDWRRAMPPGSWRCWRSSASGWTSTVCAVTGATEELVWVSPKSGRAVSRAAGAAWADRLLPCRPSSATAGTRRPRAAEVARALRLTGYFLEARVAPGPAARGSARGAGAGGGGLRARSGRAQRRIDDDLRRDVQAVGGLEPGEEGADYAA